jgi:hypothetical protein
MERPLVADMLKNSKIEQLRNSGELRILGASAATGRLRTDARVGGRFRVNRYGPSRRGGSRAPAVLKNFVRHPNETFSTVSAQSGRSWSGIEGLPWPTGPPPQSALALSLRCGRSRSTRSARLAGYLRGQVIDSGEEQLENRRGVCLVVT